MKLYKTLILLLICILPTIVSAGANCGSKGCNSSSAFKPQDSKTEFLNKLALTDEQNKALNEIKTRYIEKMKEIKEKNPENLEKLGDDMHKEMLTVMSKEQQKIFTEYMKSLER